MSLSPEDRRRIYEEEKARLDAQRQLNAEYQQNTQINVSGRQAAGCIGLVVLVLLIAFVWIDRSGRSRGSVDTGSPSTQAETQYELDRMSPEQKLALIQSGYPPNEQLSVEFRVVLDSIQTHCNCTPSEIGDVLVTAQKQLRNSNIEQDLLQIARNIDTVAASMPGSAKGKASLTDAMALYITTCEQQK